MCSSLSLLQYGNTNWTCKGKRRGRGGELFCIGTMCVGAYIGGATAPPDIVIINFIYRDI